MMNEVIMLEVGLKSGKEMNEISFWDIIMFWKSRFETLMDIVLFLFRCCY